MTYYEEARKRAKERLKSPWTIPLIIFNFFLAVGIWFLIDWGVWHFHLLWHPSHTFNYYNEGILGILVMVPPCFAAFPLAMLMGNYLFWLFPPARKSFDKLDKTPNFKESQKALLKVALWATIPSIAISLFAAIF